MAVLNRFTADLVTDAEISQNRLDQMAAQVSEYIRLLVAEADDEPIVVRENYANGHSHDATQDMCRQCRYHSRDAKNGDIVIEM